MSEDSQSASPPGRLFAGLEAILFAADAPVPVRRLVRALGHPRRQVEAALRALQQGYGGDDRGVELVELGGGWQLFTKRDFARAVERALGRPPRNRTRLSTAALETLAIIAYRQPVTRGEIEAIRGVDTTGTLASLTEHRLIEVSGRAESPGRPNLYATTEGFLNFFGLRHLGELPQPGEEEVSEEREFIRVAIDGPAGSGKSTVARLAASRLGLVYVDTGAFYRALTWLALERGVDLDDPAALVELARNAELGLEVGDHTTRLILEGRPVGPEIRTPRVTVTIRHLADIPPIRNLINGRIRDLTCNLPGGVVAEGRDIGTLLFPDTPYKFYLTASVAERARRRMEDHKARGEGVTLPELERRIIERDRADGTRPYGALTRLPEALEINTTGMTIQEVVEAVIEGVELRRGEPPTGEHESE
ncbi:(d)CMP kinase [bacterium]|nr:(d)CMP kinase [bacterium]